MATDNPETAEAHRRHAGRGFGVREWLERVNARDLISAADHSRDFRNLRAEFLCLRVRLLAFVFAALAPLWIPVDAFALPEAMFYPILTLRLSFSVLFLTLGLWNPGEPSLAMARLRLFLFLLVPALFYVASRLVAGGGVTHEAVLVGYSFLPFLLIALLAVFPLTLLEGLAAALFIGATVLGVELYYYTLFTIPTLGDMWLMGLLAAVAVWAELTQLHMLLRLYREATRDPLTGLVNRRVLNRWLDIEVDRAEAEGRPLAVLLFDLDLFKRVNDNHGHHTGDQVLRAFAGLLSDELRGASLVGRYGGEEFLVILRGADRAGAMTTAERIRKGCHRLVVNSPLGAPVRVSTSVGVAQLRPDEDGESLLRRVDKALYQAKDAGRDLVAVAE